ncbi:hypothetical protein C8T65DRAFT_739371 [Cerioporus squamosus]|nr:hypothetical protein C8T65DRAFT_739371 [Cerioporus squamosus]
MSCAVALPPAATQPSFVPRKRTMSFSMPTPIKSARTPLRRTGSYLSLADMQAAEYTPLYGRSGPTKSYTAFDSLVIGQYDYRMRKRRAASPRSPSIQTPSTPKASSSHIILTSRRTVPKPRRSSLLAPVQKPLPERPSLPCTKKREPDLLRTAIETRMRLSPVGRNILAMGPRIAMSMSVITATEALESLVAAHGDCDMPDMPALGASWVDLSQEDWEVVEPDA